MFLDLYYPISKYNKKRFEQLVKQRYLITKIANTSYEATGDMTPTERLLILNFIKEDLKTQEQMQEAMKAKLGSR